MSEGFSVFFLDLDSHLDMPGNVKLLKLDVNVIRKHFKGGIFQFNLLITMIVTIIFNATMIDFN